MAKSLTYGVLTARHAKHRLGRGLAHATAAAISLVGAIAGADAINHFAADGAVASGGVLGGLAIGAGLYALGRYAINQLLKPIYVTAEDFDAIEDELGGFDKSLLDVFQRCHGSRPMRDYEEFMANALENGGPTDFTSALFYLDKQNGSGVGQMLCYDFQSVSELVRANALLNQSWEEGNTFLSGHFQPHRQSWLDRALERPVRFTLMLCASGSIVSVVATVAIFHAL